jgi:hypothetical protein
MKKLSGLAATGLVLLVSLGGWSSGRSAADSGQEEDVVDAVAGALDVAQNAISTQPNGSMLEPVLIKLDQFEDEYQPYLHLPRNYESEMVATHAKIDRFLTGKENTDAHGRVGEWSEYLNGVELRLKGVAADPRAFRMPATAEPITYVLTSGADELVFSKVDISETSAVVSGTTRLWSTGVAIGVDEFQIYSPHDIWNFEIELQLADKEWKASRIDLSPRVPADASS